MLLRCYSSRPFSQWRPMPGSISAPASSRSPSAPRKYPPYRLPGRIILCCSFDADGTPATVRRIHTTHLFPHSIIPFRVSGSALQYSASAYGSHPSLTPLYIPLGAAWHVNCCITQLIVGFLRQHRTAASIQHSRKIVRIRNSQIPRPISDSANLTLITRASCTQHLKLSDRCFSQVPALEECPIPMMKTTRITRVALSVCSNCIIRHVVAEVGENGC
ncbi:hypothetical protein DFH09DRAFT_489496 [Mycena vulgaris]|nr:hypothetical protein DFH09DRAFT_489496 [Mycena vulgaris]